MRFRRGRRRSFRRGGFRRRRIRARRRSGFGLRKRALRIGYRM